MESDETIVEISKTSSFLINQLLVFDDICDVFILGGGFTPLLIENIVKKELCARFKCLVTRFGMCAWECLGINQEELVEEEGAPEAPTPAMEGQTRGASEQ